MWLEGLKDVMNIVSKVWKALSDIKTKEAKESNDFLNSPSTKSFIDYLNSTYTTEEIKKALWWKTLENYIKTWSKDDIDKKLDTTSTVVEIFKPEFNDLIDKIKDGKKTLWNPIIMMEWSFGEQSPIKTLVDNYITAPKKNEYLQYLWISLTSQEKNKPEISINKPIINENKIETKSINNISYIKNNNINELSPEKKSKEVYWYLRSIWYQHIQILAILWNIHIESQFNTEAIGDKKLKDKAYWICQRRWDRFENLKKYAIKEWKDRKDIYLQLDFMKQESNGWTEWYEENFLSATTIKNATEIFDKWYERSNGKTIKNRIEQALVYEQKISSNEWIV